MVTVKGLREITAIAALLVLNAFFGISDKTTSFIFPAFGAELFTIINFYTNVLGIVGVAFGLVLLYRHLKGHAPDLPTIPGTSVVLINYLLFFILSYIGLTWLLSAGFEIPIPTLRDIAEQTIIAADENTLAFIFFATIFPMGIGVGDAKLPTFLTRLGLPQFPWNIITLGEYKLNFNPPNVERFMYASWAIVIITLLHAGAYSYQVTTFNDFYVALVIAGIMFYVLWWIKEAFGFGACIAFHASWNLVLINIRGSVF